MVVGSAPFDLPPARSNLEPASLPPAREVSVQTVNGKQFFKKKKNLRIGLQIIVYFRG